MLYSYLRFACLNGLNAPGSLIRPIIEQLHTLLQGTQLKIPCISGAGDFLTAYSSVVMLGFFKACNSDISGAKSLLASLPTETDDVRRLKIAVDMLDKGNTPTLSMFVQRGHKMTDTCKKKFNHFNDLGSVLDILGHRHCYGCEKLFKEDKLKVCSKCHDVRYCSTECQSSASSNRGARILSNRRPADSSRRA